MTAEDKWLKHTVEPAPFNYTGINRRMERSVIVTMNNIWVGTHISPIPGSGKDLSGIPGIPWPKTRCFLT